MTVSIPSAGDRLLRLMMPPPGGSSGSVGGLLLGDVQFSMSLRVGKKVTRKEKKKITKRGTRIGEKTGFWLHTSMVPLDGSSVVFHKEDLDLVFKKKCPVFNEKCCVTLCMSPIDRKTQLQIMNEVKQHTRDTQEKQRKERLEREHRQIILHRKKQKLQSHKNFFSHNSATVARGGGGASSRTTNVHKDGAAATVAKALPRRMSFSQLKFKHVLLQKKQQRSSFSQLTLHQLTEREEEKEEDEGEKEEDVPHARPTDFHPQSDLIQRAKLLPLPSSPETPMALMMSPVVHLRSPQFTHTLGPWIDEARKIVANTPQRGVEKEMKTTTCVKHQDDIANLQWQPIPFYGTTRPPPPLSPPPLSPPSPPLVIVSLEEDTASKEENEEEWLTQRTMKKNTSFVVLSVAQEKRAPTANKHTTLHHHNTKKHFVWTTIFFPHFPHFQNDFTVQETALTTIPTTTATHTGARGSTARASTSFLVHWSIDERAGFSTSTPTTPT
jgi:hypothetical protein